MPAMLMANNNNREFNPYKCFKLSNFEIKEKHQETKELKFKTYPFDQAPFIAWPLYIERLSSSYNFQKHHAEAKHITFAR